MTAKKNGNAKDGRRVVVDLTPRTTTEVIKGGRDAASGMATGNRNHLPATI
jgi:hypothetical protein